MTIYSSRLVTLVYCFSKKTLDAYLVTIFFINIDGNNRSNEIAILMIHLLHHLLLTNPSHFAVIGTAFAFNLLFHIPVWVGVLITGSSTLLLLGMQKYGVTIYCAS
jgi:hypothetical protein